MESLRRKDKGSGYKGGKGAVANPTKTPSWASSSTWQAVPPKSAASSKGGSGKATPPPKGPPPGVEEAEPPTKCPPGHQRHNPQSPDIAYKPSPLPQSPPRETSWVFQCCQRTRQLGLHRSLPLVQGSTSRSSRVEVPSCQPTYSHIPSCRPHTHTSIVTHVAASMLTHCHSVITHIVATTCFINCFCRSMEMQFRDGGWRVQSPVFLVLVVAGLFSLCILHKVDCTIDVFGHYSN
jgi:hypothetical protein